MTYAEFVILIAQINALPFDDVTKASLILKAAAAQLEPEPAAPAGPTAEQLAENARQLREVRPDAIAGPGGKGAAESAAAQARADVYVVRDPTDADKTNPTLYAFNEFTRAGYAKVTAPNGPVERFGAAAAMNGNRDFKAAVQYVIDNYPAGTANIQNTPVPTTRAINAGTYTPASYTAEQKMAMQYITVNGPGSQNEHGPDRNPNVWLDKQLGGDGVSMNMKFVELGQMFGSSGTATLYNPTAGSTMLALIRGEDEATIRARLEAEVKFYNTDGFRDSVTELTPVWFAQARATVAQFK